MRKILFLFFFSITISTFSQSLNDVRVLYEDFAFEKVIELSDQLLLSKTDEKERVEIFVLKGASEFSIGFEKEARNSFIELLKIDSSYSINRSIFSPKIVELFDEVKNNFISIKADNKNVQLPNEPVNKITEIKYVDNSRIIMNAALKNIILPGWGQISSKNSTKGYLLSGASAVLLSSMIYFIVQTDDKYRNYITETNASLIETKYQDYNDSYKIRNVLIFSYAALWIYSQLDLFLFTEFDFPKIEMNSNTSNKNSDVSFGFSIPLN